MKNHKRPYRTAPDVGQCEASKYERNSTGENTKRLRSLRTELVIIAVAMMLWTRSSANPSTCSEQTFAFKGKTSSEPSLLVYWELRDGAANMMTTIYYLFLTDDSAWAFTSAFHQDTLGCASLVFTQMNYESYIEPKRIDGALRLNDSMSFCPPSFDSTFFTRFWDAGGTPSVWYRKCSDNCIDNPIFNFDSKLIYYHKNGVYKNYEIESAYFYEQSGYLIVFTHNPEKAAGLDTMHGVLIYRVRTN